MTTVTVQQRTKITFAAETDVGRSRQGQPNQDSLGIYEDYCHDQERLVAKGKLFVVADGMGGAAGGREASRIAAEVVFHSYYADPDTDIVASLRDALQAANVKIHRHGLTHPELRGLGTTIVVAVIRGRSLVVANVGDSRAYLLRQDQLRQLSLDHTAVQEQVREGLLTPEEGATHPRRHVLSRNLGFRPKAQPDFATQDVIKADTILLCSDGLWGSVADDEIAAVLRQADCETAVDKLINLANERGGPDNISGIVIHVDSVEQPLVAAALSPGDEGAQPGEMIDREPVKAQIAVSLPAGDSPSIEDVPASGHAAAASLERSGATVDAAQPMPRRRIWPAAVSMAIALLLLGAAVYQIAPMLRFPANPSAVSDPPIVAVSSSSPPDPNQGTAATLPNQTAAITATVEPTATLPATSTTTATALPPTPEPPAPLAISPSLPSIAASMGTIASRAGAAQAAALSEDGQLLATASLDGRITFWRVESKLERVSFLANDTPGIQGINSLAFSSDGKRLAAALENGTVHMWEIPAEIRTNAACHCPIHTPLIFPDARQTSQSPVLNVVFAGDDQLTAASRNGIVKLWNVASRQEDRLGSEQDNVRDVAVSADGQTLAIVDSRGTLQVTEQQEAAAQAYNAIQNAQHVAMSGDGQTLAVASIDSNKSHVTVWRKQKAFPIEINATISNVALSQSGRYLIVTLQEGNVLWFDLTSIDSKS